MIKRLLPAIIMLFVFSGCSTTASFMLPPNTDLLINGERVHFEAKDEDGRPKFETRPFFWTSIIGIEYAIVQDDKIVKKDRLPSSFRIASIFWPPYAYIYWPVGFRLDCYDLSDPKKEFIEKCPKREAMEKKAANASPSANAAK
ncbi:MAG TPA: hypothetical protein VK654_00915 [Nitrospirota bacterium]|nr:hypothetical protein [Nitrospirota bacterium]